MYNVYLLFVTYLQLIIFNDKVELIIFIDKQLNILTLELNILLMLYLPFLSWSPKDWKMKVRGEMKIRMGEGGGDASLNSCILVCNSFQGLGRPSYNIKYVYKYILAYILWYG